MLTDESRGKRERVWHQTGERYAASNVAPSEYVHCTCSLSKDSDQPMQSHSLIRIFTRAFWIAKDAKFLHADNDDSEQTARIRGLIRIFVGRTCQKVIFLLYGYCILLTDEKF